MPDKNPLTKATMLKLSWLSFLKFLRHPLRVISLARSAQLLGNGFKVHHAERHDQAVRYFDRVLARHTIPETNPIFLELYKAKAKSHEELGQHDLAKAARLDASRVATRRNR